ncbi:MAG: hypothetical protein HN509_16500 [Halobacteriovoraceae bacterium]|jgi:hypothetical protein|nr:hypothetical protein [Halobacteriovoraceae bacterium]MBT5096073.1 hypothetical protein [Halobacteriovoraceae bacterium]
MPVLDKTVVSSKVFRAASIKLQKQMETLQAEIKSNTSEMVMARKMEEAKAPEPQNWKTVERMTESKRFPLVEYEQAQQNITVNVFDPLKKLNIL